MDSAPLPAPPATPAPDDVQTATPGGLNVQGWKDAIERARKTRKEVSENYGWEANVDRYAPKSTKANEGQVNIGADFADVERKKTALFYAQPAVSLVCDDPSQPLEEVPPPAPSAPGQPPAAPPPAPPQLGSLVTIHQELLNEVLGPRHLDMKAVTHKALMNVLLVSGVGPVRFGFKSTMVPVMVAGPVDPMTGQPTQVEQQVSLHDEFWADAFSPMGLLLPSEFRDTDVRRATWIGQDFRKPSWALIAELGLPADTTFPGATEKPFLRADDQPGSQDEAPQETIVSGAYVEYKTTIDNPYAHPEAVTCFYLVDGDDTVYKHGPSPHQAFDEMGAMTPDSVPGFTIRPLWVRDLPDSAWVPADSTITGPLTIELNRFRTQSIEQRDTAKNVILYDATKIHPEAKQKIDDGEINTWVPVVDGSLANGKDAVAVQIATANLGRESYLGQDYIQADRDRILGISANQQGSQTSSERSATEVSAMQRNSDARFNHEQNRVVEWFLAAAGVVDAFLLRYADERFAAKLLGPRKGAFWAKYKQHLLGGYRHTIQADSTKYVDIEASRRTLTQLYQMTRQDPLLNPRPVMEKLLASHGIDAAGAIANEPPKASPPPPQASFTFKGDDLNPSLPQFELVVAIAKQGGWAIPEDVLNVARQKAQISNLIGEPVVGQGPIGAGEGKDDTHGGPAKQQMPLSKRQEDETGDRSGPKV